MLQLSQKPLDSGMFGCGKRGVIMFREIKKKKLILDNRKPYTNEVTNYIEELNLIDWIYSSMILDGCDITKASIQKIIKGEIVVDVTLNDHVGIGIQQSAVKFAYDMAAMGIEMNERYLLRFYQNLAKPTKVEYRRNNPILVMMDYNPPHPRDIEEQIEILFQWLNTNDFQSNPILRAAYLHNKLIEIYPFESHTEAVARMVMYYELIKNGFPPVLLNLTEQEYYAAIKSYLRKEEIQPIYEPLERGVYHKLEMMMQLTKN